MYIYIHKPHFILRVYHISVYMFCVSYLCAQALHNYLLFILRVYPISVCMFCVSYLSVQALHNYLLFNSVSHFCVYVLCVLFECTSSAQLCSSLCAEIPMGRWKPHAVPQPSRKSPSWRLRGRGSLVAQLSRQSSRHLSTISCLGYFLAVV